jgi:hypothetical protein
MEKIVEMIPRQARKFGSCKMLPAMSSSMHQAENAQSRKTFRSGKIKTLP